jgi:hypothetical protein
MNSTIDQSSFDGMIGVPNLLALIYNTAAFLFPPKEEIPHSTNPRLMSMIASPFGFIEIIKNAHFWNSHATNYELALEDYFAVCMAAHHSTVATFVPTDVDSKIRGQLWDKQK